LRGCIPIEPFRTELLISLRADGYDLETDRQVKRTRSGNDAINGRWDNDCKDLSTLALRAGMLANTLTHIVFDKTKPAVDFDYADRIACALGQRLSDWIGEQYYAVVLTDPVCPHCGQGFVRRGKTKKFCSSVCQNRAASKLYRTTHKAERNAADRKRRAARAV
jgi:ribosomal protein L37AE/L43A